MRLKKNLLLIGAFGILTTSLLFARDVPFTQEDRDRLIRLETKVEEGLKAVDQRIDGLDKRIDGLDKRIDGLDKRIDGLDKRIDGLDKRIDGLDKRIDGLQNLMEILIGAIFAQTIGIVGFVLWDRRTALSPAVKKNKEIEEKEERIERALKELAKKDKNVEEAMKIAGLL